MSKDQAQKGGEILIWFSQSEFLATGDNLTGNDGFCILYIHAKNNNVAPYKFWEFEIFGSGCIFRQNDCELDLVLEKLA